MIGIVFWYWVLGGEIDICCVMVINLIVMSFNWVKGVVMFLVDVIGLCFVLLVIVGFLYWLCFRK